MRAQQRVSRRATALAAAAALALFGCAGAAPGSAPPPRAGAARVDDAGRRYEVRRLEKTQAVRVDERRVRTRWGIELELAGEDETHWYFKYYLAPPDSSAPVARAPEARAERAEPIELPESRTLRFEPFDEGLPRRGQWREGFDVADVDGDGALDLVHGAPRKGARAPQIWLGDGRGSWRPWREARFPALPYDYGDARAADLDGDGALDLVLAVHLRGLLVLLGDGRGGFTRAGGGVGFEDAAGAGFSSRAARIADFDRDGVPDIVALGEGPLRVASGRAPGPAALGGAHGIALYRGLGGGRFERRDLDGGAPGLFGSSLAVADFDADGLPDVATSTGQFGRRDLVRLGRGQGGAEPLALAALREQAYVRAVAAADFDADGRADLAVGYASIETGSWRSGLDVLLARAGGDWQRIPLANAPGAGGPRALAAGDLDGDGRADLAALGTDGAISVFRSDGAGSFVREGEPPPGLAGCRGAHLELADLDGDGLADVLASFGQERASGGACPSEGGLAAWRTLRHAPRGRVAGAIGR